MYVDVVFNYMTANYTNAIDISGTTADTYKVCPESNETDSRKFV